MVTVLLPTVNRPAMLRTALASIAAQTAREQISSVVVSENGGKRASEEVCADFSNLPIRYIYRESPMDAKAHGAALYDEAARLSAPLVAVLHDDDWWANNHLANALQHLDENPDAVAYWASTFVVHGEASWFVQTWSISSWLAAGYPKLHDIAKLDRKQAAIACMGGAPGHYSSLVTKKAVLAEAFRAVAASGNLLDNDRLLFLELARRGPVLVNFVPEVFVRKHARQEQRSFSLRGYQNHSGATTRAVLDFCRAEGIDVVAEFTRLYEACPDETLRSELMDVITPGALAELRRHNPRGVARLLRKHRDGKWVARQVCPPMLWEAARQLKTAFVRGSNGVAKK